MYSEEQKQESAKLLAQLNKLSDAIIAERMAYANGIDGEKHQHLFNLKCLRAKRHKLLARLPKMTLAFSHPDPDSLEPFYKRTRNEVREFMGLEPVEGGDDEYL